MPSQQKDARAQSSGQEERTAQPSAHARRGPAAVRTDGGRHLLEEVIGEAQQQAGLAHSRVADEQQLQCRRARASAPGSRANVPADARARSRRGPAEAGLAP